MMNYNSIITMISFCIKPCWLSIITDLYDIVNSTERSQFIVELFPCHYQPLINDNLHSDPSNPFIQFYRAGNIQVITANPSFDGTLPPPPSPPSLLPGSEQPPLQNKPEEASWSLFDLFSLVLYLDEPFLEVYLNFYVTIPVSVIYSFNLIYLISVVINLLSKKLISKVNARDQK